MKMTSKSWLSIVQVDMSNPNGDPNSDGGGPRLLSSETEGFGIGLISPTSTKRRIRDTLKAMGCPVWEDSDGEDVQTAVEGIVSKGDSLQETLLKNYIDARLFGFLITSAANQQGNRGPIQFEWGMSIDPVRILSIAGSRARSAVPEKNKDGEKQGRGNFGLSFNVVEKGVYTQLANFSAMVSNPTDRVSESDIEKFEAAWLESQQFCASACRPGVAVMDIIRIEHCHNGEYPIFQATPSVIKSGLVVEDGKYSYKPASKNLKATSLREVVEIL